MCRLTSVTNRIRDTVERPDGVSVFVFGSILEGSLNSDIDLLCIYDAARISPSEVYGTLRPFFRDLEVHFGSRVHPVILTESEEAQVRFVETEGCLFVV